MVKIDVRGLAQTTTFLVNKAIKTKVLVDKGVSKATLHIFNEVQESVAGRRAEGPWIIKPRKVTRGGIIRGPVVRDTIDTATFKSSIRPDTKQGVVYTNLKYAEALEFGTTKTPPRRHFTNTASREKGTVKGIIQASVNSI